MIGDVSKLFDRNFVIAFYLPALLVTLAFSYVFKESASFGFVIKAAFVEDKLDKVFIVALLVWFVAVVLLVANRAMYRALEGYIGPASLTRFLREKSLSKRDAWSRELKKMYDEAHVSKDSNASGTYLAERRKFRLSYPDERDNILPTRFGNVLRAFETYPSEVYGVESIHAWPRLCGVIPADLRQANSDAKSQVDFSVCSTFLCGIVGLAATGRWMYIATNAHTFLPPGWHHLLIVAITAAVLTRAAYLSAVSLAKEWGEVVKSSFDLYLPDLAKKLGYEPPATYAERILFWRSVDSQFRFWTPVRPEDWTKVIPPIRPARGRHYKLVTLRNGHYKFSIIRKV
jgi:hypothetical protein